MSKASDAPSICERMTSLDGTMLISDDIGMENPISQPATPCVKGLPEHLRQAPRCNAISKRTRKPCGAAAMQNGKCYHHGGSTPRGIACANYKGKGYSADLSIERGKALEAIMAEDDTLVSLREDIALIKLRVKDLLQREKSGERGTIWDDLQWEVSQAQAEGRSIAPETLAPLVDAGKSNEGLWREIVALIGDRAKVIGIEGRRQADMGETATKEQMKGAIVWLVNLVKDNASLISDPVERQDFLTAMSKDISRGLNPRTPERLQHTPGVEIETRTPDSNQDTVSDEKPKGKPLIDIL